jgi:predicted esterase
VPRADNPLLALPLVEEGPSLARGRAATVLLHGRGRNAAEMIDLARRLELPRMSFVAVPAAEGTWYPDSFLAPSARNEPHLSWAIERIASVVADIEARGVPRNRIALLGFSQGACLACEYVFRSAGRWGALVALTGGLIGPPGTAWSTSRRLAGTPILLATSDVDEWVPLGRVEGTADVFRSMGAAVDLRIHPGRAHAVSEEEVLDARRLLATLLSTDAPS